MAWRLQRRAVERSLADRQRRRSPPCQESWRNDSTGANRRDPSDPPGFGEGVTTDRSPSEGVGPTRAQASSLGSGESAVIDQSPRATVVASLAGTLSRAVALGDEVAARVVHEALGRLLGLDAAPRGDARIAPPHEQLTGSPYYRPAKRVSIALRPSSWP